ncbi:MAG: hypothetical protein A3I05_08405 [Deltaproteobacteria bacterium RIFCSPLOWO2_02_FULL_44_10]|nr:MAG: hypothetical protein A3C46_05450 [Deltaproteobacteria bacterium RIFCSPHIGHO2_02_FULL_44_16]OGQ45505.1 MAG: hypothetical protein A3I05_08405 [Deltaproteobacteria bacterium RIFCSPLOWO2_02_FULL_44_10]
MMLDTLLFYLFAAAASLSALLMITRVNPLISSLWLVVSLAASAGLFALLAAPFLAVIQVLVYAGAVMVLFIFVIMLIDLGPRALKPRIVRFSKILGVLLSLYLAALLVMSFWRPPFALPMPLPEHYTQTKTLGSLLLTTYAVPFELASLLLLAAIVGAVAMGKKKLS